MPDELGNRFVEDRDADDHQAGSGKRQFTGPQGDRSHRGQIGIKEEQGEQAGDEEEELASTPY